MSISYSEMKVLEKMWEQTEFLSIADMNSKLREDGKMWSHQTVATFLRRLEEKNMVSSTKIGNRLYYYPLLTKEQFYAKEIDCFLQSRFNGSLKIFLMALLNTKESKVDIIHDLEEWFDEM